MGVVTTNNSHLLDWQHPYRLSLQLLKQAEIKRWWNRKREMPLLWCNYVAYFRDLEDYRESTLRKKILSFFFNYYYFSFQHSNNCKKLYEFRNYIGTAAMQPKKEIHQIQSIMLKFHDFDFKNSSLTSLQLFMWIWKVLVYRKNIA